MTDSTTPTAQTVSQAYSGTVLPSALTFSCSPTTGPTQVGVAYSATCTVSGGTTPYTWSVGSGALPPGVTLSAATGASIKVSGTPTSAGAYAYSVKVTDSTTPTVQTASQAYSGTVVPAPLTLGCSPTSGPTQVGVAYSATCTVSGGTAPYNWSVGSGALPAGVLFSATTGASINVSGTPTVFGGYAYSVKVADSATPTAQTASQAYSGTIVPAPLTFGCSPTSGPTQVGVAYSATCTVSGGTAPYTWSVGSGALPAGISLSASSGASITVSGTPTTAGVYSYLVKVTDSTTPSAQTASQAYGGTVQPGVLIFSCSPSGPTQVGVAYSATCTVSGGTTPYTWSVVSGSLPAGLSLSATTGASIKVTGAPTTAGTYAYSVKATDSTTPTAQTASQAYSGTILPTALTFSCSPSSGPTEVGVAYSTTCTVSGGTTPYNWSVVSGSLPAGLSLSATTGASIKVTGAPTTAGTYAYSVKVTDSTTPTAQTAAQAYSGTILPATTLTLSCSPSTGPAIVGIPYAAVCTVLGGTPGYTFSLSAGALPSALTAVAAATTYTISGIPGRWRHIVIPCKRKTVLGRPPRSLLAGPLARRRRWAVLA